MDKSDMFKGAAWFSPSVPRHVRRQWVAYGGKRAGRGRDHIRRRLWYCFCNGSQDPKIADVSARGLVAYHALWIIDSVKQGFLLPMEDYALEDCPRPNLDIVLASPKRRSRRLIADSPNGSSTYSWGTPGRSQGSFFSDFQPHKSDFSIDHDLELGDLFYTPNRREQTQLDLGDSSSSMWDLTPSLTMDLDGDEEIEQSRVEDLLIGAELGPEEGGGNMDWSGMLHHSSSIPVEKDSLELDANTVLSKLSAEYPHVLKGTTMFKPLRLHQEKMFSADEILGFKSA